MAQQVETDEAAELAKKLANPVASLISVPTLRCRFAEPTGKLLPSRWPVRESLQKYHR